VLTFSGKRPIVAFGDITRALDKLRWRQGWTFHDFRGTAATKLWQNMAPHVIEATLGHAQAHCGGVQRAPLPGRVPAGAEGVVGRYSRRLAERQRHQIRETGS
jgi:hypothetical protein